MPFPAISVSFEKRRNEQVSEGGETVDLTYPDYPLMSWETE